MNRAVRIFRSFFTISLVLILAFVILSIPKIAESEGRLINSGPYSLTVRGGANSDSAALGLDARANFLDPVLNFHLFGTYDVLNASNGIGEVDNQRFGAGFAFSKTYPDKANIFAGSALIKELDEYFGHAYVGGKLKVSDYALLTGSYGFGLGPKYDIMKKSFLTARASNWGKLGGVLVRSDGLKLNFNYYLTDPGGENISRARWQALVSCYGIHDYRDKGNRRPHRKYSHRQKLAELCLFDLFLRQPVREPHSRCA